MSPAFETGDQSSGRAIPQQPAAGPPAGVAPGASEVEVRLTASYVAAAFSAVALIVACVALGLSLRPRPAAAPVAAGTSPAGAATATRCPASAHLPPTANDHGAAPAAGTALNVEAGDFFFAPTCGLNVPTSSTITLTVHNGGQALHNVSFPDQGIDTDVAPGQTVTVNVKIGGAGTYGFFCKYHRTSGMVGTLVAGGS